LEFEFRMITCGSRGTEIHSETEICRRKRANKQNVFMAEALCYGRRMVDSKIFAHAVSKKGFKPFELPKFNVIVIIKVNKKHQF
jgi:hypothetical protein